MKWHCPNCDLYFALVPFAYPKGPICPVCQHDLPGLPARETSRRRSTDGWACTRCKRVYFEHTSYPLCPWCYRDQQAGVPAHIQEHMHKLTRRLRALVRRDGRNCWLCGQVIDLYDLGRHRASADHVVPRSEGGKDGLYNLKLAHQSCNGYRSGSKEVPFAPFERDL